MAYENFAFGTSTLIWLIPLIIWSTIWKGIALWKAGKHNQLSWFVIILIVNTVGILEIIYLAFFQPKSKDKRKKK